jgi:hypothetical protein
MLKIASTIININVINTFGRTPQLFALEFSVSLIAMQLFASSPIKSLLSPKENI